MNIREFMKNENEKPLDNIVSDGGFCSIFRTIACIGDSLSSGEFESVDENGNKTYHDLFEYSWGQFIARMAGCKVYNFSRGGMTAKEYCEGFARNSGFWGPDKASQAYIIALGVNDLIGQRQEVGSIDDICDDDCTKNNKTFAGYYSAIIQRYKKISPDARFFLMTMPRENDKNDEVREKHRELLYAMSDKFDHTYVLDFYKYAPEYNDEFKNNFFLLGHLNACGYVLTAKMAVSYIDYIIRSNVEDFRKVGFINSGIETGI